MPSGKDKKKHKAGIQSVPQEMAGMEQQFDHEATLVALT